MRSPKISPGYRVRKDAKVFFVKGRVRSSVILSTFSLADFSYQVFALLWHESAGGGGGANGQRVRTELSDPVFIRSRFGEEVYSHIRRMVVVKDGHGFCLCL